jgi:hypothetical protein
MDIVGFTEESLMAALSHLVDNRAHGTSFVSMVPPHMTIWLRSRLEKYYYYTL